MGIEGGMVLSGGSRAAVALGSNRLGAALKPKRSAVPTRRSEPILGPSGAKTLLHERANAWTKVPPHSSLLALAISRPPTVAELTTGNRSSSLTTPASSAAVVVITLKVEPGGCGAEKAIPARASTEPCRASSTATPPRRPARAATAAACSAGSIVVCTGRPGTGSLDASTRPLPARVPGPGPTASS